MFEKIEISRCLDHKFRLIIPQKIIKTRGIKKKVYLANVIDQEGGHPITRIYYKKPAEETTLEIDVKTSRGVSRITLPPIIRKNSFSFYYGKSVMVLDAGTYMEILPWPSM